MRVRSPPRGFWSRTVGHSARAEWPQILHRYSRFPPLRQQTTACSWPAASSSSSFSGDPRFATSSYWRMTVSMEVGTELRLDSPVSYVACRRSGAPRVTRRNSAQRLIVRLPLLLFEDLGAALAKVGEMDETDSLRFEELFRGGCLTGKRPRGRAVTGWF